MTIKRTIILSDDINKSNKAILSLECENTKTFGEIRLFGAEFGSNLAIGIKNGEKPVIKIPLVISQNFGKFSLSENLNNGEKIFCALVDISNKLTPKVLVSGCDFGGDKVNEVVEIAFLQSEQIAKEEMYEIKEDDIEKEVVKTLKDDENFEDCARCVNCKYRQCFYEDVQSQTAREDVKNEEEIKIEDSNFFSDIKSQIDDLFLKHSKEIVLEKLIPNSKWVRVNLENGSSYYVLGLIYEDEKIEYIAYGLPAKDNSFPPEDLKDYAQWLPLNEKTENVGGYWLVYQSASSGESVLINVV